MADIMRQWDWLCVVIAYTAGDGVMQDLPQNIVEIIDINFKNMKYNE